MNKHEAELQIQRTNKWFPEGMAAGGRKEIGEGN